MAIRYEQDFYGWTQEQAQLLRARRLSEVDLDNVIEEIESMGRSEKRELKNRLAVLLTHLLKWAFQPAPRSTSWQLTIQEQRLEIPDVLEDSPSLQSQAELVMVKAYSKARRAAAQETRIPEQTFPVQCPWTFEQAVDPNFLPESSIEEPSGLKPPGE